MARVERAASGFGFSEGPCGIKRADQLLYGEIGSLFRGRHVCFIGYSGSDLDLFPMIRDFSDIKTPFWVDPYSRMSRSSFRDMAFIRKPTWTSLLTRTTSQPIL